MNTISPVVLHHGHAEAGEHCARRQLGRHLLYEVVVWGLARAQGMEHLEVETSLFLLIFKNFFGKHRLCNNNIYQVSETLEIVQSRPRQL